MHSANVDYQMSLIPLKTTMSNSQCFGKIGKWKARAQRYSGLPVYRRMLNYSLNQLREPARTMLRLV